MSQAVTVLSSISFATYIIAMLGYQSDLILRRERNSRWAIKIIIIGVIFHAIALLLEWVGSKSPLGTASYVASLFAWLLAVALLILQHKTKATLAGSVLAPIIAFALLYAFCPRSSAPPTGPLRPEFLWPHLGFIIASYVCFALAFAMAVFYFIGEHSLKAHRPVSFLRLLPPLAIADRSADRLVAIGLPLLTLGILMGVILANQLAKPLFTLNDLKLPLAVLTWLFFASYLIARHVTSCSRKQASLLIVIGFIILLITFLGATHTIVGA